MKPAEEPSGVTPMDVPMMPVDSESHMGFSAQESTKSSKGRKLRQVLQKKQLDVLLQTYSSYIEEPGAAVPPPSNDINDFYTISRKKSIEGNLIPPDRVRQTKSASDASIDSDNALKRASTSPDIRRMRKNKSLISEDEPTIEKQMVMLSSDDETEDAVNDKRNKGIFKKGKKKHITSRRKKRGDFSTRMNKANDVVRGFSNRCTQKHLEMISDFQEATKELRHHLKSGANIAFEDLADHFDGIVENLFVGDGCATEQRDDDGGRPRRKQQQQQQQQQSQDTLIASNNEREPSSDSERELPSFRPLSHDEAILKMSAQVNELLEPVVALTDKVYDIGCSPSRGDTVAFDVGEGEIVELR